MLEWLWPWAFAALPLPLLVRLLLSPSQRTESALTVPDMNTFAAADVTHSSDWQRQVAKLILISLCWAALVTASARPQWTGDPLHCPPLVAT